MSILILLITVILSPVRIIIFQAIWALNNLTVWLILRRYPDIKGKARKEIEARRLPWRLGL